MYLFFLNCFLFSLISSVERSTKKYSKNRNQKKTQDLASMKLSIPMPGGGTGLTLFSKLVRTKDLRSVQGEDPRPQSTKPKLAVNQF